MGNGGAVQVDERSGSEGSLWARSREGRADAAAGHGRVLVIEDLAESGQRLVEQLESAGCSIKVCADARDGLPAFLCELPDLIVTRACDGDREGLARLREIRELADIPVVLVGGTEAEPILDDGFERRAEWKLAASADAGAVARLAAKILADRMDRSWRAQDEAGLPAWTSSARRLTAAQVRRLARSELEAELERQLIDCRGNLAEMARRMGKDRSTIRYHLRRFGMLVEDRPVRSERTARATAQSSPSSRRKAYSTGSPTSTS